MAFVRYTHNGAPTVGIVEDGLVYPTSAATLAEALVEGASAEGPGEALDEASLLPCVDPAAKILCVALNYVDHAKEANVDVPESPIFFFKCREAMIAAGDPIQMPKAVTEIDWEGELAIIIGKDAFEISKVDAWDHIAGIAPFNDGSARNILIVKAGERRQADWFSGKCLNKSTPMGPVAVPAGEVLDELKAGSLRIKTTVSGEVKQEAPISDMVFDIPTLVAFASSRITLSAGDVIATGTPPGVGFATKTYMKKGDVVEVVITGLPTLRNVVA